MDASAATWERAEAIFHGALALEGPARAEFLARETAEGGELARIVADLLEGHAAAGAHFLQPPAGRDLAGTRIGEFTLERLLGEGGMGAVYEALQDRPRRRVAVKIVRTLPGTLRDARRLELEAELLGRLAHPSIAQIHAAGLILDPGGKLAWFAMELVRDALDLTRYVAQHSLDLDQRLTLFESLCRAVQHGHQRGVLHCDLKPGNVLVDSTGVLKVIDFGIARTLGAESSQATLSRRGSSLAGTLAYMSPERAGGSHEPDVRGDVYSLGVILHELVLSRRPLDLAGKSLTQALAAIRDESPPAPRTLDARIDRDLETILLTALEKDPERRYASVAQLADDLARFRRREPIAARPPGVSRKLALFVRRNRVLVSAATLVASALIAATIVSTLSAVRATRARDAETIARANAERMMRLHQRIFDSARPVNDLGRDLTVREILDDALFNAERELADDPRGLAEILGTLGTTYGDLGRYEEAERVLGRALESGGRLLEEERRQELESKLSFVLIRRGKYAEADTIEEALLARPANAGIRAGTLYRRSELLRRSNRVSEADAALEQALATIPEMSEGGEELRARILVQQAMVAYQSRDFARAEQRHREALSIQEQLFPPLHPTLATTRNGLAGDLFDQGRIDEAEALWNQVLETFERVLDDDHPDLATVVANLALVHERRRDFVPAEAMYERALLLREKALGDAHPALASLQGRYSAMLLAKGDLTRAEEMARRALETRKRSLFREQRSLDDPGLAADLFALAMVQRRQKNLELAEQSLRDALRIQRATLGSDHADSASTMTLLGAVLLEGDRAVEAEPLLREACDIRARRMPDNWLTANTRSVLGGCLARLERFEEAEKLLADSLPAIEKALGAKDFRARDARERLAALYERTGRAEESTRLRAAQ